MSNRQKRSFFSLFIFLPVSVFSQNPDISLLRTINRNETIFKNKYLEANASSVNNLGMGIPIGLAIAGFIKHDKELKQNALYIGVSFLMSGVVTQSLKHSVNRPRAYQEYAFIVNRDDEGGGMSFPSGHTSAAFCTATAIALRYHKWYFVTPAYIYATSVGWARMYQGVHYPSDVLAGAIVGAGSAWIGWKAQKWISGQKTRKKRVTL